MLTFVIEAYLDHELRNDTVERRTLVVERDVVDSLLTGGEETEVAGSLGNNLWRKVRNRAVRSGYLRWDDM